MKRTIVAFVGIKTIAVVAISVFLIFCFFFMFLIFNAVLLTVDDFVPTINLGFLSGEPTVTAYEEIPEHFLRVLKRAQEEYGVSWAVLAAISKIETDFGKEGDYYFNITAEKFNKYGVDADGDGNIEKGNLYDLVYTVANMLKKNDYKDDPERALEAYLRGSAEEIIQQALAYSPEMHAEITDHIWPVPGHTTISSKFGPRIHPIYRRLRHHDGIDIPAPLGTPVVASADGKVVRVGKAGGYGNLIVIQHHAGIHTYYAHLSEIFVRYGDKITKGQVIGAVGSTGRSTGYHLHFEIRINRAPVDPLPYLPYCIVGKNYREITMRYY